MGVKFKKRLITTDVTAIRFVDNFVLAGVGGSLHIFDSRSSKMLSTVDIFTGQKIHGIELKSNFQISIFGGKMLAHCEVILKSDAKTPDTTIGNLVQWRHSDWILHLKWLTGDKVAIVTAHNNVSLHDASGNVIARVSCAEKCIVYCALLVGESWDDLVVLGGTVFQEVVVWGVRDSAHGNLRDETAESVVSSADRPVLHRLKGHNGVIFSLSWDAASLTLVSSSDDRSVRRWTASRDWSTAAAAGKAMYGHRGRAWRAAAAAGGAALSVGEDGALCAWAAAGGLVARWEAHAGARVWCLDRQPSGGLVATGGGDGGVSVWPLRSRLGADLTPAPLPLPPHAAPRRVGLLGSLLVSATDQGTLLTRRLPDSDNDGDNDSANSARTQNACSTAETEATPSRAKSPSSSLSSSLIGCTLRTRSSPGGDAAWVPAAPCPQLASLCLLDVSPGGGLLAAATRDGRLVVFRSSGAGLEMAAEAGLAAEAGAGGGKLFALLWLTDDRLLSCGAGGAMAVWAVTLGEGGAARLSLCQRFVLPVGKEAWPSAAVLFAGLLVCGDRAGSLHVFPQRERQAGEQTNTDSVTASVQTLPRLHGRLGVTCVASRGQRLWTAGRDGVVRQLARSGCGLQVVAADKVPVAWPARLLDSHLGMLVLGFCEVEFVVWSWREQRTLLSVSCGGGHRSWDFRLRANADVNFTLVHVKDKAVFALRGRLHDLVRPVLQPGFHTKEIGCVRLLTSLAGSDPVVISASEDTTVRLSRLRLPGNESARATEGTGKEAPAALAALATLRSHVSSVRALAVSADQRLLFTAGGRAQLKVWSVGVDSAGEVAVTERAGHMLRVRPRGPWRDALPAAEPETRYMDLCCLPADPAKLATPDFLMAACSDGLIRFFSYDRVTNVLALAQETSFHDRCVLKVSCLVASPFRRVLLSMATDGRCAFWENPAPSAEAAAVQVPSAEVISAKPFAVLPLHQSGINSVDWVLLPADRDRDLDSSVYLLATGGDDNALVLTLARVGLNDVVVLATERIESSHAAQITGVCLSGNLLVTACIDQRVRVWRWHAALVGTPALACTLAGHYVSSVSDLQGLQVWPASRDTLRALVHGKGMEVIDINIT